MSIVVASSSHHIFCSYVVRRSRRVARSPRMPGSHAARAGAPSHIRRRALWNISVALVSRVVQACVPPPRRIFRAQVALAEDTQSNTVVSASTVDATRCWERWSEVASARPVQRHAVALSVSRARDRSDPASVIRCIVPLMYDDVDDPEERV